MVNLEVVNDGYSKYITLSPSMIRRLDGREVSVSGRWHILSTHTCTCKYVQLILNVAQEIIVEATTENKGNSLKMFRDELNKAKQLLTGTTSPANGSVASLAADISKLVSGVAAGNSTSGLSGPLNGTLTVSERSTSTTAGSNDTTPSSPSTLDLSLALHPPTYAFMLFLLDPNGVQVVTEISLSKIEITSQVSQQSCLNIYACFQYEFYMIG